MIDQAHWAQLEQVQSHVNNTVRYMENGRQFGMADIWEVADREGDCKDIALAKRKRLMELGWPPESLRMALAYTETGEMHAVLTVDVSTQEGRRGTYVLDNRFAHVEPWQVMSQFGYRWVERAGPSPYAWTYIGNLMALRMAAVAMTMTAGVAPAPSAPAAITPVTLAAATNADEPAPLRLTASFSTVVAVTPVAWTTELRTPVIYWQARHSS
jgi:hypothetical protein